MGTKDRNYPGKNMLEPLSNENEMIAHSQKLSAYLDNELDSAEKSVLENLLRV